ncbi:MAG: dihydropyrimidinase, partial [Kiloniellales bacterium]|nr:dihydropyrimidinase [Kiloniellales bacterium]
MADFDLLIKGGTLATASDCFMADIAVRDGTIVALGHDLGSAAKVIDASGLLVLPGGIDAHCHIEQESSGHIMTADDFYSGSISAAFGGTTTILPFAAQHRGESLRDVVEAYHGKAGPKSVIDYAFHLILSDPNEQVLGQELPALIEDGYCSFKVYLTYESLKIDDRQLLDILSLARRHGAMTLVHAENDDVISWVSDRLLAKGYTAPKYHAISHPRIAESEASRRAIDLARLVDARMLIVHVSEPEAADAILKARNQGLEIYGETCPQYLFLTADDLDRDGMEGAKFCCSPPPRDKAAQEAIWRGLKNGTFQVFSSDHAPYRYDESGKLASGPHASFRQIANGVPGLE